MWIWSISMPSERARSAASFIIPFLDCISHTEEISSYEGIYHGMSSSPPLSSSIPKSGHEPGYASIRRGYESIDQMVTSWPRNPGNQATDFSSGRIEIGLQTAPFGKIDTYQPLSAKLVSQTTLVEEVSPKNSATVRRTLLLLRLPP